MTRTDQPLQRWRARALAFVLASLLPRASDARAQARDEGLAAEARVAAPVSATAGEDPTASMTALDPQRAARGESVADVLLRAPGARVSDAGGVGAYTTLGLRGAGPEHTSVVFDTIPLGSVDAGAFDLSTLPPGAFERIEVYRGGAPVWVGEGAIGGTLRLLPAQGRRSFARIGGGAGSFGRYELSATSALRDEAAPHVGALLHAALRGADNDYGYRDDALAFDDRDGGQRTQRNARLDAGDLALHGGVDLAGGRLALLSLGHGQTGGLPGALSMPTRDSRRTRNFGLLGASWEATGRNDAGERSHRIQLSAATSAERDRVSDHFGELRMGIPTEGDDVTLRVHGRAAGSLAVTRWLEPSLVASVTEEAREASDRARVAAPPRSSRRLREAFALEPRVHGTLGDMPAELRPSARVELSQAELRDETTFAAEPAAQPERSDAVAPTFRLAASLQPSAGLLVSASAATGRRLPSMLELFGDRAALAPSLGLVPERSHALDASAVLAGRVGPLAGRAELRPFITWIDDVIRYRRIDEATVKAENVARAQLAGVELGVDGSLYRHLSLAAALTLLRTESQLGHALPLRPSVEAFVRPELVIPLGGPLGGLLDRVTLFVEAHHVGVLYLDDATNDTALPARTLLAVGAGLELLEARLAVHARVTNLLDAFASDVLGRPLPGRALLVLGELREELP